jgi:leucine dehydrogenase
MERLDDQPLAEEISICRDETAGLLGVIVIDDTRAGAALGGIRMRPYPSLDQAVSECARLARTMSLKCALAEVGYGGGKSVIVASDEIRDRDEVLRAFGRFVARRGGAYLPAADMGTNGADLEKVAETAGKAATMDTSKATARGVFAAIEAAVRATDAVADLNGVSVFVQGVGNVGSRLAGELCEAGARVLVSDTNESRAEALRGELGVEVVAMERGIAVDCDVYAPCAVARTIAESTVDRLGARIVAGAANDVLDHPRLAATLAERGIVYVPDFVASAGGVIQVRADSDGWSGSQLDQALIGIGSRVGRILAIAADESTDTDSVARSLATDALADLGIKTEMETELR